MLRAEHLVQHIPVVALHDAVGPRLLRVLHDAPRMRRVRAAAVAALDTRPFRGVADLAFQFEALTIQRGQIHERHAARSGDLVHLGDPVRAEWVHPLIQISRFICSADVAAHLARQGFRVHFLRAGVAMPVMIRGNRRKHFISGGDVKASHE